MRGRWWPVTVTLLAVLVGSACGGNQVGGAASGGALLSPTSPTERSPSGTSPAGPAPAPSGAAAPPSGVRLTATIDALGPARIGEPVAGFARDLGRRLEPLSPDEAAGQGTDCWVRGLVGLAGVGLTVPGPKDDQPVSMVRVSTRAVRMSGGVGVGSTETEIRATYPRAVRSRPNKYTPGAVDLYVRSGQHEVLFEADPEHRVTSFRFGESEQVELVEGCS